MGGTHTHTQLFSSSDALTGQRLRVRSFVECVACNIHSSAMLADALRERERGAAVYQREGIEIWGKGGGLLLLLLWGFPLPPLLSNPHSFLILGGPGREKEAIG